MMIESGAQNIVDNRYLQGSRHLGMGAVNLMIVPPLVPCLSFSEMAVFLIIKKLFHISREVLDADASTVEQKQGLLSSTSNRAATLRLPLHYFP